MDAGVTWEKPSFLYHTNQVMDKWIGGQIPSVTSQKRLTTKDWTKSIGIIDRPYMRALTNILMGLVHTLITAGRVYTERGGYAVGKRMIHQK